MAAREPDEGRWKSEILYTLDCVRQIRARLDNNELFTVRQAREAGFSWTEIATRLGVPREIVVERWEEAVGPCGPESPGASADGR